MARASIGSCLVTTGVEYYQHVLYNSNHEQLIITIGMITRALQFSPFSFLKKKIIYLYFYFYLTSKVAL